MTSTLTLSQVGERKLFDWERRVHAEDMYALNTSDCINKYVHMHMRMHMHMHPLNTSDRINKYIDQIGRSRTT